MDTPPSGNLKIQHIIRALFEHVIVFLKAVKSPIYYFITRKILLIRYYINIIKKKRKKIKKIIIIYIT